MWTEFGFCARVVEKCHCSVVCSLFHWGKDSATVWSCCAWFSHWPSLPKYHGKVRVYNMLTFNSLHDGRIELLQRNGLTKGLPCLFLHDCWFVCLATGLQRKPRFRRAHVFVCVCVCVCICFRSLHLFVLSYTLLSSGMSTVMILIILLLLNIMFTVCSHAISHQVVRKSGHGIFNVLVCAVHMKIRQVLTSQFNCWLGETVPSQSSGLNQESDLPY